MKRPVQLDKTPVHNGGEPLGDIWWRGRQWAVTEHGIEALDGSYFIAKDRLLEEQVDWPWPRQIGEKTWADPDEFATAFMVAVVLHGHSHIDPENLRKHLEKMSS